MRGFVIGSLALIALSVAVNAGMPSGVDRTGKLVQGLGITQSLFVRLLSPNVAGIPQKK